MDVADDIYQLSQVENEVNVNTRLILIKEKLNNILATLRYSSSYANVQNSYGTIFASLGVKKEEIEQAKEKIETEIPKEVKENTAVANTPLKQDNEIKVDTTTDKQLFEKSKIRIRKGDKLSINGTEYIVQKSDDIQKITEKFGTTRKAIIDENYWLLEKHRVKLK